MSISAPLMSISTPRCVFLVFWLSMSYSLCWNKKLWLWFGIIHQYLLNFLSVHLLLAALVLIACHIYLSIMQSTAKTVVFGAITTCLDQMKRDLASYDTVTFDYLI